MSLELYLDERTLPLYLQKSIKDLVDYQNSAISPKLSLDLYWGELYGSINSAQHDLVITKEIADYLREKYLGI